MFEDQLVLIIRFENNGVLVEALDPARQFHSSHQVNRRQCLVFPDIIQKHILNILNLFFHSILLSLRRLFHISLSPVVVFFPSVPLDRHIRAGLFKFVECHFEAVRDVVEDG